MATKLEIKENAQKILKSIGNKENVISAAHCATRLRLVLKDESLVYMKMLESISLFKGQFSNAGQFQIILVSGIVDEVYKYFVLLFLVLYLHASIRHHRRLFMSPNLYIDN